MSPRHAAPAGTRPRTAEHARLAESASVDGPWRLWGPYLAGRQWGTVREDYSADGDAWAYFPFEHAHRRAYRWGEDGLGGICDRYGFLNVSLALWNEHDELLKERLFGLSNEQGNHGEDVKEYWWVLDGTPTHSWMRWRYRYPQAAFPYEQLRAENARRGRDDPEYELIDTGVLEQNRFFDVTVTYAKAAPDDIAIVIEATNHGPDPAPLHLLPQLWFRNTWVWGRDTRRPSLRQRAAAAGNLVALECEHDWLGRYYLAAEGSPEVLACENETNALALFGAENRAAYTKDGIDTRVVHGDAAAVYPDAGTADRATKAALWYRFAAVPPGASVSVRLRLSTAEPTEASFGPDFDSLLADRRGEADEFYAAVIPAATSDEDRHIARRAFAGLLWNKQLYRYDVAQWLAGDPAEPAPPPERIAAGARNVDWQHVALADVISMPDEWEYPWFAAWDLAFHCVALAHVDPAFAKDQLLLLGREWAMHPDGQLPAYEWAFGDVNPPVQAWAAWHVYRIDAGACGEPDTTFLIRVLTKLLLAVGWWVNVKEGPAGGPPGNGGVAAGGGSHLFAGGFLGMDNIGLFNRSAPLPGGARLEQSDATSWMAFLFLHLLRICGELARTDHAWDEAATTFCEHFCAIAHAMGAFGSQGVSLWNDEDGFYYDVLVHPSGAFEQLRVRSMVGLLPLLAVAPAPGGYQRLLPDFTARLRWLQRRRPDLLDGVLHRGRSGTDGEPLLFSLVDPDRLRRLLARLLDPDEFLSPHGVRSLSAAYRTPFTTSVDGQQMSIDYEPGESRTGLFGGNSNWRGPVWFPVNVLLIEALHGYGEFFGDSVTVELPTGSGNRASLCEVADDLAQRLISLFRPAAGGQRPADGGHATGPLWSAHPTFYEYFHGDTGQGLGASHQTGWSALVAHLICRPR